MVKHENTRTDGAPARAEPSATQVPKMHPWPRLLHQRRLHLADTPPLEGPERWRIDAGAAQELLHQVAGNTVRGFRGPPVPWMRWLEVLWLAPMVWAGVVLVTGFGGFLGGMVLNELLGHPVYNTPAYVIAALAGLVCVTAPAWLSQVLQLWRTGRPLHTTRRRAREEHVMAELLFQILVRHDVTSGPLGSGRVGVYASDQGWDVSLPSRGVVARSAEWWRLNTPDDAPHWLSLRCDARGRWALHVLVWSARDTHPWQGVDWGDARVDEPTFDAAYGLWRLNLRMEDHDGLLTEFTDHKPGLKHDADALLAAWADRVALALQPVFKQPGERAVGVPSRWAGALPERGEPEGPQAVAAVLPSVHASYDPEGGARVLKRARQARWGAMVGRVIAASPAGIGAIRAASDGAGWGAAALALVALCVWALYAWITNAIDAATMPPPEVRVPNTAGAEVLVWDGEGLALGEARVGLERAFACTLSRRLGGSEGQTPMLVVDLVPQRKPGEAEEARGRVRFQVEVERSEAWDRLDRLDVHAPTLPGDAFDAWVWPLIQARLLAHGADLPGVVGARVLELERERVVAVQSVQ